MNKVLYYYYLIKNNNNNNNNNNRPPLYWNQKRCSVLHVKRGAQVLDESGMRINETATITTLGEGNRPIQTHTHNASRLRVDENICVSDLEDGNQYKFLGFLETVRQEQKMFWSAQLRSFLRSMSIIWSSPCLITTV